MCLSWLHFQPCAGSETDCNCCLSNKYTYMQLRSPEVTRVNFHLSHTSSDCTHLLRLYTQTSHTPPQTSHTPPQTVHTSSACTHLHKPYMMYFWVQNHETYMMYFYMDLDRFLGIFWRGYRPSY